MDLFEQKIAEYTGAGFAVACVNGTSALHIALILAGVRQGDEVIVPTITFIAPVNAVKYCGAFPVFMDSDDYYNIDSAAVIDFLVNETEMKENDAGESAVGERPRKPVCFNRKTGRRISALIPVHVFGNAARLDEIKAVCRERNIRIVEDATESLGTRYRKGPFAGKQAGTIGDLGCLSFNGNKIITTGGGGMVLTDDEQLAKRARYLTTQAKDDEIRYVHGEVGYNYRLTNIQAAVGVAQMESLPEFLEAKKRNYSYYKSRINEIAGLSLSPVPDYADNNHWMYTLRIDPEEYGRTREELMSDLAARGIQSRPVWQLNHLQTPYGDSQSHKIERAVRLHSITLNIPCSVNLRPEDMDDVVTVLSHG